MNLRSVLRRVKMKKIICNMPLALYKGAKRAQQNRPAAADKIIFAVSFSCRLIFTF